MWIAKTFIIFLKVYYRVKESEEENNDSISVGVNETLAADAGAQQENFVESAYVKDNDIDTNPSNV